MRGPPGTFQFPPELGRRFRDLRLRAGLTQPELAQANGRTGKGRANIVLARFRDLQDWNPAGAGDGDQ
jgi:hypothetical protein